MKLNHLPNFAAKTMERWATLPYTFVQDVFHIEPDPWQKEALQALHWNAVAPGRVSVRACHGPGKSAVDAWAIFWFQMCYFPTRIPCTAPTSHQLEDILWAELHKWHRQMDPRFRDLYIISSERCSWAPAPKESFAVARTARPEKPEALQGFHCENLLFVLDEASGIDDAIFEVSEGALSDENAKVLMTANPTRRSGYFYESHNRMKHRFYTMRISHDDSPRVSNQYVEDMRTKWGEDSNVYRVRVLGEFPLEDENVVIPLDYAETSIGRDVNAWGEHVWGLDVAGKTKNATGDRSVLCRRRANQVYRFNVWRDLDPMQLVGAVADIYDKTPDNELPTAIYVDTIGLGAGVAARLRELDYPVVGVNVSESATDKQRFMRLRDDLWFRARDWFGEKDVSVATGDDEMDLEFVAELTVPTYKPTSSGKFVVESKDDLKARGVNSPDLADSFIVTGHHRFDARSRHAGFSYKRQQKVINFSEDQLRAIV